ncbi:phosphotransferase system sugar-specific permease eiia type 1 [Lucifera butyrica]|uniref:Phosphotransferase system sugar-specific permease eiia type 1 n=1 Tax=Lucifera butyrica TaxID=1351585 RepID=A0A498RDE5_9FIRM|nr:beta-glucoside-specific PTS transporter subunit IIABC [Lucifera butyrica]VBB08937.1 phosphotransferase system sugar-specific permease eiia type 1 [Lucifera butyrica]
MDYSQLAANIICNVGGEENVISLVHCATRLRFKLKNRNDADKKAIKNLPGVLQVVESGGQFQIVIGNEVSDVYRAIAKMTRLDLTGEGKNTGKPAGSLLNQAIDLISGIFTPLLGAMAGAGMLKGLLTVAVALNWLTPAEGTYQILFAAADSLFYFLPLVLAFTAARKFDTDPYVAVIVAGTLLYPGLVAALNKGISLSFLGIPVVLTNYATSVVPIILAVYALSKLEPLLNQRIHASVRRFLTPLILLVVIVPLTLIVFGPFGTYVSKWIGAGYSFIYEGSPILAGIFMGAFWQTFVIFGLHWGLVPIMINNLTQYGADTFATLITPAVFAQAGAALGVWLKSKQREVREIAGPAALSGIIGITEPAIYGITLRYKKPFILGSIAGAIGGGVAGLSGAAALAFAIPGLMTLPVFFGKGFGMFAGGIALAFGLAAVLTYFFGYKDEKEAQAAAAEAAAGVRPDVLFNKGNIASPLTGRLLLLRDVKDKVFASGALGKGIAIFPKEGKLFSPVNGIVTTVFPTGHAIGITAEDGIEVLIHVGLNTVQLVGQFFDVMVEQGSAVKQGDLLLQFNMEEIEKAGYDLSTPVIITNSDCYLDVIPADEKNTQAGELLLTIVK